MELNESNIVSVINLLTNLSSSNNNDRINNNKLLNKLEETVGYGSILIEIFNSNIDINIKLLAIISFKNYVERIWTKNISNNMIDKENEKNYIRNKLLTNLNYNDIRLSKQLSVIISRIARYDWPKSYDILYPTLLTSLTCNNENQIECTLGCLHQISKQLSSKKAAHDQILFEQNSTLLIPYIRQIWENKTKETIAVLENLSPNYESSFRCCLLCVKNLRYLLPVIDLKKSTDAQAVVLELLPAAQIFWQNRHRLSQIPQLSKITRICDSILLQMAFMINNVLKAHPLDFRGCLGPFFEFFIQCLKTTNDFEYFIATSFDFFNNILTSKSYTGQAACFSPSKGITFEPEAASEAQVIVKNLFNVNFVNELIQLIITRYLILNVEELEEWSADPETFFSEELKIASLTDCKMRSASLNVLGSLLNSNFTKAHTCSVLVNLLQQLKSAMPATNNFPVPNAEQFALLLQKDAIFCAIGVNPNSIMTYMQTDFQSFYFQMLTDEIQACLSADASNIARNIIFRRLLLLIAQFHEFFTPELRSVILQNAIIPGLNDKDVIVRLSAAELMHGLLTCANLTAVELAPFSTPLCSNLLNLIANMHELDLHIRILPFLKLLIERLEQHIIPLVPAIVGLLPLLWSSSANHKPIDMTPTADLIHTSFDDQSNQRVLLRQSTIRILTHLVTSLGPQSVNLYSFAIPVLSSCTYIENDPNEDEKDLLAEDVLELWLYLIKDAPHLTPELLNIFPKLFYYIQYHPNFMDFLLKILNSYLLFNSTQLIEPNAMLIANSLYNILEEINDKSLPFYVPIIETISKLFPNQAPSLLENVLIFMLKELLSDPPARDDRSSTLCIIAISRLFASKFDLMYQLLLKHNVPISALLDIFFNYFDGIREVYEKKSFCIGMVNFLGVLDNQTLKNNFSLIIDSTNSTLAELYSDSASTIIPTFQASDFPAASEWTEGHRIQNMIMLDSTSRLDLKNHLSDGINFLMNKLAKESFQELIMSVDPVIINQFQSYPSSLN